MRGALLAIGTELVRGELADANAAWLSGRLTDLGVEVVEIAVVGDEEERIGAALDRLAAAADIVIATGGLGPTSDDRTAAAVARCLGAPLERHDELLDEIRRRFAALGREIPASNAKQADLPRGAAAIPNRRGTAPGFTVRHRGALCHFLPGVPGEMRAMFEESLAPQIVRRAAGRTHQVILRCFGMTESRLADIVAGLGPVPPGVVHGYRASFPEIEFKVIARAASAEEAESRAREAAQRVRGALGRIVFAEGPDPLPAVVAEAIAARGWTLAIREDLRAGALLASRIAQSPAGERVLAAVTAARTIAPATEAEAQEEAARAREQADADVGLALSRHPAGEERSEALWAVSGPGGAARRGRREIAGPLWRQRQLAAWLALRDLLDAVRG